MSSEKHFRGKAENLTTLSRQPATCCCPNMLSALATFQNICWAPSKTLPTASSCVSRARISVVFVSLSAAYRRICLCRLHVSSISLSKGSVTAEWRINWREAKQRVVRKEGGNGTQTTSLYETDKEILLIVCADRIQNSNNKVLEYKFKLMGSVNIIQYTTEFLDTSLSSDVLDWRLTIRLPND